MECQIDAGRDIARAVGDGRQHRVLSGQHSLHAVDQPRQRTIKGEGQVGTFAGNLPPIVSRTPHLIPPSAQTDQRSIARLKHHAAGARLNPASHLRGNRAFRRRCNVMVDQV